MWAETADAEYQERTLYEDLPGTPELLGRGMSNSDLDTAAGTLPGPVLEPRVKTGCGGSNGGTGERSCERRFALLHQANLAFNTSVDMPQVADSILSFLMAVVPATASSLWLLEPDSDEMVCRHALGTGSAGLIGCRLHRDADLLDPVLQNRHMDTTGDDQSGEARQACLAQKLRCCQDISLVRSLLSAPLQAGATSTAPLHPYAITEPPAAGDSMLGMILVACDSANAFSEDDRSLLDALAASAAAAIGNAQLYERARREIAGRIRTEQALRESESRYRTLIETSPNAILVTDSEGMIVLCNSRATELYGYQRKTGLIGRPLLNLVVPEMLVAANEHFRRVIRGETPTSIELIHSREDGTTFDAEFVGSPIANNSGAAAGIVAFVEDITARKDAERAIQRHNLELRILNAVATQTSQTQDLEQLLTTALERSLEALEVDTGWARIFGEEETQSSTHQSVAVVRGAPWEPALVPGLSELQTWLEEKVRADRRPVLAGTDEMDPTDKVAPSFQVVGVPLQSGDRIDGIIAAVGLDHGHPRPMHVQQVQLLSAIGHQVSTAIENARLSAHEAEVEMLRELEHMRSGLLASFSHDLRSPLGIITMACSTLLRHDLELDKATHDDMLVDIQAQSARLLRLVDGILDLGRLQHGHLRLKRELIDLGALIRRLGNAVQKLTEHHSISFDLPEHPLWISADSDRTEQVLFNLLDNAVKYSPDGGEIVVRAEKQHYFVCVNVTNYGIGIDAGELELIFERFYRVRTETTKHISGAGLGLATCKGIVEAHGGKIWAESDPERGTTFSFTLPAAPQLTGVTDLHNR